MDTDNVEPKSDREPLEINVHVHKNPSVHSFDSSSTNIESHNKSELHENTEINMNANNENEEFTEFDIVADVVMHEETNDHSLEPQQKILYESSTSSSQSSPGAESSADSLSPGNDDAFSSHTKPSETPLSPPRHFNIIKFHSGSGIIQTFGTSVIISFKGKTDEQTPFVFQNEIANQSK